MAEVKFEDLEKNPLTVIRNIYAQLDLNLADSYEKDLCQYIERVAGYRKNRFPELSVAERHKLNSRLGEIMERWGYRLEGEETVDHQRTQPLDMNRAA